MAGPPILVKGIQSTCCPQGRWKQTLWFRLSVLILTFLSYMFYHMSRKPITVVKNSEDFLNCHEDDILESDESNKTFCRSWISEIDGKDDTEAKSLLGLLDTAFLVSYAVFMFFSGFVAERMDLRFFLSMGMMLSGLCTILFGIAYPLGIHSIWYFIAIQVLSGLVQATGWPGVVTVMANWFGKGKRGLVMGIWNSHTSFGNIIGSLVASAFVGSNWGLSFTVPGVMMGGLGFLIFLFLVPSPEDVNLGPAEGTRNSVANVEIDPLLNEEVLNREEDEDDIEADSSPREPIVTSESSGAIGFLGALKIPGVLEFSFCLFFAKMVSYTFLYWLPNYIHVQSQVNAEEAAVLSTIFDWGGIFGGILAGVITDKTGMSATTCTVMLTIAIPVMYLYEGLASEFCPINQINGIPIHDNCFYWNATLLAIVGILVNGPYALITTAVSAELGQHPSLQGNCKALATVTAIIDGTGSFGTTGSFLAGPLSSSGRWGNVFFLLMGADFLALLLLLRLVKNEIIRLKNRGWRLSSRS